MSLHPACAGASPLQLGRGKGSEHPRGAAAGRRLWSPHSSECHRPPKGGGLSYPQESAACCLTECGVSHVAGNRK